MNELLELTFNQRKIKKILNVIFVGSIVSYVFELALFKYYLIEISDYRHIYEFFISGHFIIPFALFYLIWITTIGIRMLFFQVPNVFITKKFGPHITNFLIWIYTSKESKFNPNSILPKSKSLDWMIKSAPNEATQEDKMIRRVLQSHRTIESDYTLIVRAFIAITIYFNHLEYFGWISYTVCVFLLLFMWLLQIIEYQSVEVLPYIVKSNKDQMEVNQVETK